MKTTLTYIFVAVSCLLFGGLVGSEMGRSGRTRVEAQRDKAIGLTEKCVGQLNDLERLALKCVGELRSVGKNATQCCDAAEKALDERDACRKKR